MTPFFANCESGSEERLGCGLFRQQEFEMCAYSVLELFSPNDASTAAGGAMVRN